MKRINFMKRVLVLLVLCVIFSSCHPTLYPARHVPLGRSPMTEAWKTGKYYSMDTTVMNWDIYGRDDVQNNIMKGDRQAAAHWFLFFVGSAIAFSIASYQP